MQNNPTTQKRVLIVHNGSPHAGRIIEICQAHGLTTDKVFWEEFKAVDIDHDLIILTGGHEIPVSDHNQQYAQEIAAIRGADVPIIGICLGFELIAKAFFCDLVCMPERETRKLKITKLVDDPVFENVGEIVGFEAHRWIVPQVSSDLIALAKSEDGIEAIKHKTKPIYGFQFHPEESREDDCGMKLFENLFTMLRMGELQPTE